MKINSNALRYSIYFLATTVCLLLAGCSTTSSLKDGEQLYTGLLPIEYTNYEASDHQTATQEELEAALATAPNGALFGSSYYRTPFPYALWIWNSCSNSHGVIKKWLNKTFGKAPVLMNNVNPSLRTSIAKNILQNNGYFNGNVTYSIKEGKPERTKSDSIKLPRTAKIKYRVDYGHLYTLDTITRTNFLMHMDTVLENNHTTLLHQGEPFSVENLDAERNRIYDVLRNRGYYYYQKSYTTFLADTLSKPGSVQLQVRMLDSLPDYATHKWIIGKTTVQIRRQAMESLTDSIHRRYLTIRFAGKKSPLRPGIVLAANKLRPGELFSEDKYEESINKLSSLGIFSSTDISFTPQKNSDGTIKEVHDSIIKKYGAQRTGAGILDMTINTTLDKPYDVTFTATGKGKTNGRVGPGITLGLSKRNAFRGGELLMGDVGANYEFQSGGSSNAESSYDFTTSLSLIMPRLLAPSFMLPQRKRWYVTPSTSISLAGEKIKRAGFFTRNILSFDYTYTFQPSASSVHVFTPFSLIYGKTTDQTLDYIQKLGESITSLISTADELTPRMRYKYTYSSQRSNRNPIYWETTVTEAGNILNLVNAALGHNWNTKNKKLLETPYSQFVKIETDISKTWRMKEKSDLIAHFYGGAIFCYGNSTTSPYSEQFFIGGANDLRGFTMRGIGPGNIHFEDKDMAYVYHNGDLKLLFNLEYRPHLFGSLYGALFLDAGNVWYMNKSRREALDVIYNINTKEYPASTPREYGSTKKVDIGIDIGCGIRYDLDFFVLRLDWGLALHTPYKTGVNGFFNIPKFKDAQCINFAIGYPF